MQSNRNRSLTCVTHLKNREQNILEVKVNVTYRIFVYFAHFVLPSISFSYYFKWMIITAGSATNPNQSINCIADLQRSWIWFRIDVHVETEKC